jgi:hypothetical protein
MGSLWWLLGDTSVLRDFSQTKESSNLEDKGTDELVTQFLGLWGGHVGCEMLYWRSLKTVTICVTGKIR